MEKRRYLKLSIDKKLCEELTFINPVFTSAMSQGHPILDIPEFLSEYYADKEFMYIPREYIKNSDKDLTVVGDSINLKFIKPKGFESRDYQTIAVKAMEDGASILTSPCGKGKTYMAIRYMIKYNQKTMILVHNSLLFDQWKENLLKYTSIHNDDIGFVRENKIIDGAVCIGMIQSLMNMNYEENIDFFDSFGFVIVDEVHRIGTQCFKKALCLFPAKRRLGLSATPHRMDGLDIHKWHIGDNIHYTDTKNIIPKVFPIAMPPMDIHKKTNRARQINLLTFFPMRNSVIQVLINRNLQKGRNILVLSHRRKHLSDLHFQYKDSFLLLGGKKKKGNKSNTQNLQEINEKKSQLIFSTYKLFQEAVDVPHLDCVILTTSFTNINTIQQTVGRILRDYPGKPEPIVIDCVDGVNSFFYEYRKRLNNYEELGYKVSKIIPYTTIIRR